MTRDQINRYERECVNRAGVFLNRNNPGNDAAQRLIRNIERRKAKREGEKV